MKIRGKKSSSSSQSSSSSSSSSSYHSSITAAHSLASSQNSSDSSCPSSSPMAAIGSSSHRCHGLDLLVKAIHQVTAGSIIGVPYIQRRVTIRRRRRRRGLDFDAFVFDELSKTKWRGSGLQALGS